MNRVLLVVLLLLTVRCAWARPNPVDIGPEATLRAFIHAFDNLDWDKFRSFFADDATVFYPRGIARRAHGRAEIEDNFQQVFTEIRGNRKQPPYMDLQPHDLHIQHRSAVFRTVFGHQVTVQECMSLSRMEAWRPRSTQ